MYFFKSIFYLVVFFVFFSCNHHDLDGASYISYFEDEGNGLRIKKKIEDFDYMIQYCTPQYLFLKDYKTTVLNKSTLDYINVDDSLMYFKFRIKNIHVGNDILNYKSFSNQDYYSRIEYLSYGFEENIVFVDNKDTLYPAIYHFERNYGVAPFIDILFAFNSKKKLSNDASILIDDRIFNNGIIKFTFSSNDINNIPNLISK